MCIYGHPENKWTFRIRWLKSFRICVGSFIELLWRDLLSTSLHIPCQNFLWARHHLWRPTDLPFQLHHSQSKVKCVVKEKLLAKSKLNWFIRLHTGTSLALIVWFSQWQNYTFIQPFPLPNLALGLFWGIFPGRFNTFPFLEKSETLQKVHLVAGGKSPLETVVWILSSLVTRVTMAICTVWCILVDFVFSCPEQLITHKTHPDHSPTLFSIF